jgi:hypothetical protein
VIKRVKRILTEEDLMTICNTSSRISVDKRSPRQEDSLTVIKGLFGGCPNRRTVGIKGKPESRSQRGNRSAGLSGGRKESLSFNNKDPEGIVIRGIFDKTNTLDNLPGPRMSATFDKAIVQDPEHPLKPSPTSRRMKLEKRMFGN